MTPAKDTTKKTARVSSKSKTVKPVAKSEPIAKLRIRISAYESKILDASVRQIVDTALRYDVKVLGPIPLPTEIKNTR